MAYYTSGGSSWTLPQPKVPTVQSLTAAAGSDILGFIAPLTIISPFTKAASPIEKILSKVLPFSGKEAATTIKIVDKSKVITEAPKIGKLLLPVAGGVAGGFILAKLFTPNQQQQQTQAPITQNPTNISNPITTTNTTTNAPQTTTTTTNTITKYIYDVVAGGAVSGIAGGNPEVSPAVTPSQTTPIYISVPTTVTQPTTATETQQATQTSDTNWIMLIAAAAIGIGLIWYMNKKRK